MTKKRKKGDEVFFGELLENITKNAREVLAENDWQEKNKDW